MKKVLLAGIMASALAGCGVTAKVEARNDYQASEAQYKACLTANPAAPQNCEGLRLAMEADERKFTNMGAAAGGVQASHNVAILNR